VPSGCVVDDVASQILSAAMVVAGLVAWVSVRAVIIAAFGPRETWWPGWVWRWAGRAAAILAMAPFVAAGWGSRRSAALLVVAALLVAVLILRGESGARLRRSAAARDRAAKKLAAQDAWLQRHFIALMAVPVVLGFALLALLVLAPVVPARALGSPTLVALGSTALIATVALAYRLGRYPSPLAGLVAAGRAGSWRYLPVLALAITWGVAIMVLGLADNHRVGQRGGAMAPPLAAVAPFGGIPRAERPQLPEAFARWLATLPAASRAPGATIPVVVVATAGGASRAAYWTGEVLAQLDGPRFRRHLFAISSVSGGTLGTAAYLAELECGGAPGAMAPGMRAVNGADHLSPTVGSMLFPDLFQRLLPAPLLPDRAWALEQSFAQSWRARATGSCRPDRFDQPFLRIWSGPAWRPLWFSNGTRVQDGRRLVTAPVQVTDALFAEAIDWHQLTRRDVTVAQAVTNSARFPLVSPTGAIVDVKNRPRGGVIDGGYFENGGVATANDVVTAVVQHGAAWAAQAGFPGLRFRVLFVMIDNNDDPDAVTRQLAEAPLSGEALGRVLALGGGPRGASALQGLYMTRTSRGEQIRVEAARALMRHPPAGGARIARFNLCHLEGRATEMNWFLSGLTRERLKRAFDGTDGCATTWRSARDDIACDLGDRAPGSPGCAAVSRRAAPNTPVSP
jgi:hypothetical protein